MELEVDGLSLLLFSWFSLTCQGEELPNHGFLLPRHYLVIYEELSILSNSVQPPDETVLLNNLTSSHVDSYEFRCFVSNHGHRVVSFFVAPLIRRLAPVSCCVLTSCRGESSGIIAVPAMVTVA